MPVFYVDAKTRHRGDAGTVLRQLNAYLKSKNVSMSDERLKLLNEEYERRQEMLTIQARPREDGALTCHYLCHSLRNAIPEDAVVLCEAVTNTGI